MTAVREDRNRQLLERSAALLAADYPLAVLLERFCDTIAAAMNAATFIALPSEDGTLRICCASNAGQRCSIPEPVISAGSGAADVLHSGRRTMLGSTLYLPVVYGDRTLAVLSVTRADGVGADEVRVLESLAHHLAIGIRNQRRSQLAARRVRYPWLLAAAIVLGTLIAIGSSAWWTHERLTVLKSQADADAAARVSTSAQTLRRAFEEDAQLATLAASVVGPVRRNRALAVSLIVRILAAREDLRIFGMGVYYQRGMFSHGDFGQYVEAKGLRVVPSRRSYHFSRRGWYRAAIAARGRLLLFGPFVEGGRSYISTLRAFRARGTIAGVVVVDERTRDVIARLRATLRPGERAYITNAHGTLLLQTGSASAHLKQAVLVHTAVGIGGWTLYLSSPDTVLQQQRRSTLTFGIASIVGFGLAGAFLFVVLQAATRVRRATIGLERQREELAQEIATRVDAEERLRSAAYHDALTGLPNRTFFLDQLGEIVAQRGDDGGVNYAVLFIDLDRFHVVNDSMGHSKGDALLRAIAGRLQDVLPAHALVARLGGDEFVLLLPSQGDVVREAVAVAEDVLGTLANPFSLGDRIVFSGASIGIVHVDAAYDDAETVLRDADISMYQAKRGGRSGYAIFDHAMRERVTEQALLEESLRGALERREIVPHYQPIVTLADGTIAGFEMLARWQGQRESALSAGDFIGVAEQAGMLHAIDAGLFTQACRDAVALAAVEPGIAFSINISASDLTRPSLLPDIESTMQLYAVPPRLLQIEITETAVMDDAERALSVLQELRARGFQIVVDDFGVGYSSLSYLQRLPIVGLKIDRSFIAALPGDRPSLEIVRAIVALAKTLGLYVTAEGVERAEQVELLRSLGVRYAQGFFFSPAVPFEVASSFFAVRAE